MAGMQTNKSFQAQAKALGLALEQFRESMQKKIVRGGVNKALRILTKGIKAKVPSKFKGMKRVIGFRMAKKVLGGKVGAGVGVKKTKIVAHQAKRAAKRTGRPGVGIGAENIHWFIMGTGNRVQKTTKRETGSMPPQVPDLIKQGVESRWNEALNVMAEHIRQQIPKEAAKMAAKVNAARKG